MYPDRCVLRFLLCCENVGSGAVSAVADKLRDARALVARGWTQGAFGRDVLGKATSSVSCNAICWCASGALIKVAGSEYAYDRLLEYFQKAGSFDPRRDHIAYWNDAPERTQAQVLAAFDKAIELAEREQ
jgi:hypothetical protein